MIASFLIKHRLLKSSLYAILVQLLLPLLLLLFLFYQARFQQLLTLKPVSQK